MTLLFSAIIMYFAAGAVQFFFKNSKVKYYFMLAVSFAAGMLTAIPAFSAVRSLSSSYINYTLFGANITFVLDNINASIILFIVLSIFLSMLAFRKTLLGGAAKSWFLYGLFVASSLALLTSVNGILFTIYLDLMLIALLALFNVSKKFLALSQLCLLPFISAFAFIYGHAKTIEFGKLLGVLNKWDFVLIASGVFVAGYVIAKAHRLYSKLDYVSILYFGTGLPVLFYILIRCLFLWQIPEEFISYLILVFGFMIAFWGVFSSSAADKSFEIICAVAYKNIGVCLVAFALAMFGIILKVLPASANALFAVYFLIFNQIVGIPALLISKAFSSEGEEVSGGHKFLSCNLICSGILSLVLIAIPPLTAFVGGVLICNSIISGFEVKNYIFIILLLIVILLLFILEIFTARRIVSLPKTVCNHGLSLIEVLPLWIFTGIILFAGVFPHIAIEFFITPVFVFSGGNLYVPQVMLSNISIINISFVTMFVAFYLLRFLLLRGNK